MKTFFIEATQAVERGFNHGKFAVGVFEPEEWTRRCYLDATFDKDTKLLPRCGWGSEHIWVLDLQTGEGACFRHGGMAKADLDKRGIWVCPMFEPFLEWLYQQPLDTLGELPPLVALPAAPAAMAGYRRRGPLQALLEAAEAVLEDPMDFGPRERLEAAIAVAKGEKCAT